jgi:hypothetical protein
MLATATCTVAVHRDTEVDGYADTVDDNTAPVATGVPVAVREQTRRVWNHTTATPRVVRTIAGRVAAGTDIRAGDRLVNEQTAAVYLVDAVGEPADTATNVDLYLELRATS